MRRTDYCPAAMLRATIIMIVFFMAAPLLAQPDDSTLARAKENFNLGLEAQQKGNREDAITFYGYAISSDPAFADAYLNLGSIYFTGQAYTEAAENFKKYVELKPDDPVGFTNLGKVDYIQHKYPDALQAYQQALAADKNYAEAYKEMGKLYFFGMDDYASSIDALEKYFAFDSTDAYSQYLCGVAYKKVGQNNKAITQLKKSLALDAGDFEALYTLAGLYLDQGSYTNAATYYRKALKIKPKDYRTAYNLAIAVESNDPENYSASIKVWEDFLKVARKDPRAKTYIERTEQHLKDLRAALAAEEG